MLRSRYDDLPLQQFADRFESDGEAYLFRKSPRSAPVRVTSRERDEFVARFRRDLRILMWSFVTLTIAVIVAITLLFPEFDLTDDRFSTYLVVGPAIGLFLLAWYMMWNAPARALERRTPAGPPRTREEALRRGLADMSWGLIATSTVGWLFAWSNFMPEEQAWPGWWYIWIGVGMALPTGLLWRAWQKWRLERPEV